MLWAVFPVFSFTWINKYTSSLFACKNNHARKEPTIPSRIAATPTRVPISSVAPIINPPFMIWSPNRIEAITPITSTAHPMTLKTLVKYGRKRYSSGLVPFQPLLKAWSILWQGGSSHNLRNALSSKETTLRRKEPALRNRGTTLRVRDENTAFISRNP